jgi:hypothetical protein
VENTVAAQREREAGSGGRLEGKGGRGWFRERVEAVEKRVSDSLYRVLRTAFFASVVAATRSRAFLSFLHPFPPSSAVFSS